MKQLTIGKLAALTGVTADTLCYYEKMKLLKAASRSSTGYRLYNPDTVHVIRFIRGAKALNFTLEEIRRLLIINTSDQATCAEMMRHTESKIAEAENKIEELKEIKRVLADLVKRCPGDDTPIKACPIVDHIRGKVKLAAAGVLAIALSVPHSAWAKPISYVGGVMVMQENDESGHTVSMDYTITPDYAVGWYDRWEDNERDGKDFSVHGPEFNTLIKRWNLPDGQANIFNSTGAGIADRAGRTRGAAWSSILADYETRRIYGSYEVRGMVSDINSSVWQRARVGVAPYLANYDDVATWFMVQVDDHPSKRETFAVTPLVRLFYKTTLVEVGYSSNRRLMFNWDLQF